MWTRTIAFVTYLITVISVKGWFSPSSHRRMLHSGGSGSRSAIISSRDDAAPIIAIEDTWPQLAGKQTSATAAAGKVIREAWAAEVGNQSSGSWTIRRQVVEYHDGGITFEGLYARPEGVGLPERIPGVIVAHTAVGIPEDFILWKLDSIARLGYAAFALDMFGARRALWDRSESIAARRPITENRSLLQVRAVTAVDTLRRLDGVDSNRLAAIGYCFGGMVVLDLARVSPPIPGLRAVASLHGILAPMLPGAGKDPAAENASVGPRVLVLHAIDDPFVCHEEVQAMEEEFARRQANIEIVKYGGRARHAFTRPEKTGEIDVASGLSYDKHADVDSWQRVIGLLRDELA